MVTKCLFHSRYSVNIWDLFLLCLSSRALPPCRLSGRPDMGYVRIEGFIPVSILPITCIGRIFPLHKKLECSAPPPRCCLWDSVSLTATPQ